ncbi:F-box/kelch-repeat protein At3g06240-like [Rutidosis leptorrhynchoides]|uniref:F-box/kelch-repeat protein At3g06240-like n=1 Tax=Rutidosis leptorrhynchoides TaxID=125765 RepID=UPI003A99261B
MTSSKNSSVAATNKEAMVMNYLPDDVLRKNIFIRLPSKQVAQMRSLSKTWNSVLSDSSFIKSHLHHSIHNNKYKFDHNQKDIIAFYFAFRDNSISTYFTLSASQFPNKEPCNYIKLPPSGCNYVIGSVNGLISFSNHDDVVHLWNPSLSAALIPLSDANNIPSVRKSSSHRSDFRFGYDPKTDDYKVVNVRCYYRTTPQQMIDEWLPVKVYSVRKGCWESVTGKFPSHITSFNGRNVLGDGYDGRVHWLCDVNDPNNKNIKQTIVAFDLSLETFTEISLPPEFVKSNNRQRTNVLGVLFEKLCVISCVDGGDYEVWVMEEYGVATSWVMKHVISCLTYLYIDIVGFSLRGDLIFRSCDEHCLGLYNPNAEKLKILSPHMIDKRIGYSAFVDYVDSVVWPVTPPADGKFVSKQFESLKIENE